MAKKSEVVGLFGVGLLGSAIADRLTSAQVSWVGYDPARPDLEPAPEAVLAKAGLLILCLPDSAHAARLLEQIDGPRIVIDATTGDPREMAAFADSLRTKHIRYLDVTVGGSSTHLRNGSAILMAGAADADFQAAAPLLRALSDKIFHCGPPGAGAKMKLVFNLVLGLNRAALAEGLAFAERIGLGGANALEILQAGPAASAIMERKGPKMLSREYAPEARLAQHHKDVRLMLAEAAALGMSLPLTQAHDSILTAAEQLGHAASDNSALIETYRSDSVVKP
ncbi:MAG TPA: NAD(P)-dependent oxidoreductase [Bryobacteraceae bacterium]|nr:NAD(P)-dependent oxidoreductase [Bryobacteraceae bacterium]